MNKDLIEAKKVKNEIQRLLLQNRAHNYLGRQVKGKLIDMNNHVGLITNGSAIHKRKLINDQAEYELCFLLDLSGSIYSTASGQDPFDESEKDASGLKNMISYAYLLMQVFLPILGKTHIHIYGFNRDFIELTPLFLKRNMINGDPRPVVKYIYDEVSTWCSYKSRLGGNHDGYALTKAVQDTKWKDSVDVTNRIVVHFSDGQPACGGCTMPGCFEKDSELVRNLRNSIKRIEESGYVLVGVGIQHDGVQRFYNKHNVVATSPIQMFNGTLNILRQQIKRGNFK